MDLHVDLSGRRALVTGGATGIGRAISEAFIDNGAAVAIGYRSSSTAANELMERAAKAPAVALSADLTDPNQVDHLCSEAAERLGGPIDILVNNAGIYPYASVRDTAPEEWSRTLSVNLTGPFLLCHYALPSMVLQQSGNILNMTSQLATFSRPGRVTYSVTKAGLDRFTINLAEEVEKDGITVNALMPGLVATDMTNGVGDPPDDVVPAALWLLEKKSIRFTGQVVSRKEFGKSWGL